MARIFRLAGVVLVVCTAALFVSCESDDNDSSLTSATQVVSTAPTTGDTTATAPSGPLSVSVEWEVVTVASVVAGHNQESYRFTANVTGGVAPYTYRWNFGDGTGPVEGSPVTHKFYSPGSYSVVVIVRDAAGTVVRSDSGGDLEIEITASPFSLSCHVSPTEGEAPLEVTLRAEPTGNVGPITWSWDFGDGTESDQRIAAHIYDPQGYSGKVRLTATATATDGQGRSVQCSQQIVVTIPDSCVRMWTSTCVELTSEEVVIGADGCLDSVAVTPSGISFLALVAIYNHSTANQTVQATWAGGANSTDLVVPGGGQRYASWCPPITGPTDGPIQLTW